MRDWFLGLEPRERLLVAAGAVVLVLLLLGALIVLTQGSAVAPFIYTLL